ncbi:MAG: DUF4301 family protein, partial [Silvanigrellaceae bacterium]|nr:DUF4301 family protein [Silvanigrellaceae bacterium]
IKKSTVNKKTLDVLKAFCCAVMITQCYKNTPKALIEATSEGDSFLKLKVAEQIDLFPCRANFLVVPAEQKEHFKKHVLNILEQTPKNITDILKLKNSFFDPTELQNPSSPKGKWNILEQSTELCTIRFDRTGEPIVNKDGSYSLVSAGHGELIHLFDHIIKAYPNAQCLHIRNIDNIIGTSKKRVNELFFPSEFFRLSKDLLDLLRRKIKIFIDKNNSCNPFPDSIEDEEIFNAINFFSKFIFTDKTKFLLPHKKTKAPYKINVGLLFKIFCRLFFWNTQEKTTDIKALWFKIDEYLNRPLSVMGVVRKKAGDVGGGPVFAKISDGSIAKICLEMPHANPEDAFHYFGPEGKATYFNPVLAFFEISFFKKRPQQKANRFAHLFDDRFWLLTKREHLGKPVCYHETILYELIGNSSTTNLVFLEVPRTLFRPHKTYFEILGQNRKSYGFDETLST